MDRVSTMLSFVKVVDTGGFSSAARQLNLATSVVTTHVKRLEDRLGVRLLNRTTRSVSLTEAGKAYYERCVQILSELEDADEAAQTLQTRPRGVLRVNTSPGIPVLLAPSIAEYSKLYPEVKIHLTATSRMLDLVDEGFDLAMWYAAVADPGLIIRRLAQYRVAACASPEYLATHGRPQHPSELTKHNWLGLLRRQLQQRRKGMGIHGSGGGFSGADVRKSGNQQPYRIPPRLPLRPGNTGGSNSVRDQRSEVRCSRVDSGRIFAKAIFGRRALSAPRACAG